MTRAGNRAGTYGERQHGGRQERGVQAVLRKRSRQMWLERTALLRQRRSRTARGLSAAEHIGRIVEHQRRSGHRPGVPVQLIGLSARLLHSDQDRLGRRKEDSGPGARAASAQAASRWPHPRPSMACPNTRSTTSTSCGRSAADLDHAALTPAQKGASGVRARPRLLGAFRRDPIGIPDIRVRLRPAG